MIRPYCTVRDTQSVPYLGAFQTLNEANHGLGSIRRPPLRSRLAIVFFAFCSPTLLQLLASRDNANSESEDRMQ